VPPERRLRGMPIYTDKRTGKKVIQYQVEYKYVPDLQNPGKFLKRPKYKTEVIGRSARVARKVLSKRESEWEKKKYAEEFEEETAKPRYTFAELLNWYIELPTAKKKRSYDKDDQRSKILLNHFGDIRADKIKPSMVESFQYRMLNTMNRRKNNYKPATINRMVALMKRVYNLAIREDMVTKNPCWKVSMLREDNKRDRILSADEFKRLLKELPKHLVPIVSVAYYTGMRRMEILNLTWKKVNMQEGYINLEPEDTKTSEPRRIYFNGVLWEIFQKAGKVRSLKHDFVFTFNGKPLRDVQIGFRNALKRARIENFHFHDLRHTFYTNMRKAGVDQTVIMKLTGHKTLSMFHRYNTVDQEDAINAMKKLDLFLSEQKSFESSDHVQTGTNSEKDEGSEEPSKVLKSLVPRAGVEPARWGTTEGF
jgi:integrase